MEGKMVEITAEEQNKVRRIKGTEYSIRDFWDDIKYTNIWLIGVPEEEGKKKVYEKIFEEVIVWKFPQNGKGNSQVQSKRCKESDTG